MRMRLLLLMPTAVGGGGGIDGFVGSTYVKRVFINVRETVPICVYYYLAGGKKVIYSLNTYIFCLFGYSQYNLSYRACLYIPFLQNFLENCVAM